MARTVSCSSAPSSPRSRAADASSSASSRCATSVRWSTRSSMPARSRAALLSRAHASRQRSRTSTLFQSRFLVVKPSASTSRVRRGEFRGLWKRTAIRWPAAPHRPPERPVERHGAGLASGWLASMLAAGAVIGALAMAWIQGRGDAREFGQFPGVCCGPAGGQRMETDTWVYCAVPIREKPPN